MDKQVLEAIENAGIKLVWRQMDTGESRFSASHKDGSAYLWLSMPESISGSWLNSHSHKGLVETVIIQKGWIGYVELIEGVPKFKVYRKGEVLHINTKNPHTTYMTPGAVMHVVKRDENKEGCGNPEKGGYDWWPSPELDEICKSVSEADLLAM